MNVATIMTPYFMIVLAVYYQFSKCKGQLEKLSVQEEKQIDDFLARGLEEYSLSNWTQNPPSFWPSTSLVNEIRNNSISSSCLQSLQSVVAAAKNGEVWALRIFDAFGKIGNGITDANIVWAGNYDLCVNAIRDEEIPFGTQYCWTSWSHQVADFTAVKVFICIPDTCTEEFLIDAINDLKPYIKNQFSFLQQTFTNSLKLNKVECLKQESKFFRKPFFIISMMIVSVLLGFVITGTIVDYKNIRQQQNKSKDDQKKNDSSAFIVSNKAKEETYKKDVTKEDGFKKFICCFSMYTNAERILKLKANSDHLSCLHGIRVFSLAYVIFGHSMTVSTASVDNPMYFTGGMRDFSFNSVLGAVYAVDTFFILSGLLVIYMFFKNEEKKKISWIHHYVDRFLRITPVYWIAFILFMGIFLQIPTEFKEFRKAKELRFCLAAWPQLLTYLQNFGDVGQECFAHTWYLGNEMMFFWLTPFFLILMKRYRRLGIMVLILTFIFSFGISLFFTNKLDIKKYYYSSVEDLEEFMKIRYRLMTDVYVKPYCRIGSYSVGMGCGWFLYRTKSEFHFSKIQVIILWIVAVVLCVGTIFYPWFGSLNDLNSKIFIAISHNAWSVGMGIIIILCCSGYGGFLNTLLSWPGYMPISHLSYSTYLIHLVVLVEIYSSTSQPMHFTYTFLLLIAFGNFQLCLLAGFFLNILVESPALRLREKYYSKKKIT